MSLTKYLLGLVALSCSSLGFVVWCLFSLRPLQVGWWAVGLMLVAIFFFLAPFLAIIGFYLRLFYANNALYFSNFVVALRQGAEIALFVVMALLFQSFRMLNPLSLVLLAISFICFELYFQGEGR